MLLEKIKEFSPKSILLVTGKTSYLKSDFIYDLEVLKEKYVLEIWNYKKSFPDFKEIEKFIEERELNYDLIISYGGGTVIDTSKLISISNNFKSFQEVFEINNIKTSINHLCIPTTFGSGSESTSFAVLYNNDLKYSIQSPLLIPDITILNHKYTLNLNGKNSYCSIMDSLCQSIESLWSVNNTLKSSEYALKSIRLIFQTLNNVNSLTELDRESLLLASNLSGKAINITKTTAPHAFSYYLTINHNLCHGEAVSILFEKFIDLNFDHISKKNKYDVLKSLNLKDKSDFILFFKNLKNKVGFTSSLKDLRNLDLKKYADSINQERLKNNPVNINPQKFIYDSLH